MAVINIVCGTVPYPKVKWVAGTIQFYLRDNRIPFQCGSEVRPIDRRSSIQIKPHPAVVKDLDLVWESGMDVWYDLVYEDGGVGDVLVSVPSQDEDKVSYTLREVIEWLNQNPSLLQSNADVFPRIWFVSDGTSDSLTEFSALYHSFGNVIPFVLVGTWAMPASQSVQQSLDSLVNPLLSQGSNVMVCPAFWIDPVCEETLNRYGLDLTSVAEFAFKTRLGTYRLQSAVRDYTRHAFAALDQFWSTSLISTMVRDRSAESQCLPESLSAGFQPLEPQEVSGQLLSSDLNLMSSEAS